MGTVNGFLSLSLPPLPTLLVKNEGLNPCLLTHGPLFLPFYTSCKVRGEMVGRGTHKGVDFEYGA